LVTAMRAAFESSSDSFVEMVGSVGRSSVAAEREPADKHMYVMTDRIMPGRNILEAACSPLAVLCRGFPGLLRKSSVPTTQDSWGR